MNKQVKELFPDQEALRQQYLADAAGALADASLIINPYGKSPLTGILPFYAAESGTALIQIDDFTYHQEVQAGRYLLPLFGFVAEQKQHISVTFGHERWEGDICPMFKAKVPGLSWQGSWTSGAWFFILGVGSGTSSAWDRQGRLRWVFDDALSHDWVDMGDGTYLVGAPDNPALPYGPTALWRMDLLGYVYASYHLPTGLTGGVVVLPSGEAVCISQGTDEGCLRDRLLWLNLKDGTIQRDLRLADYLPKAFGEARQSGSDWLGAQTLSYDAMADLIFISCHQQSAVIAIRGTSGEVVRVYAHKTPWPKGPWQEVTCDLGAEPWLRQPFGAYGNGDGGFRVLCEDERHHGLKLFDVDQDGRFEERVAFLDKQSHVLNNLQADAEGVLIHAGGRQVPSHRVALFQQLEDEAPKTWSETLLYDVEDEKVITQWHFDAPSYTVGLALPQSLSFVPTQGVLGRWAEPLSIDVDLPMDSAQDENGDLQANLWLSDGRLYLQAQFFQGEAVALILRQGNLKHTYYVQANKKPYGAFWLKSDTQRPERYVIWALGIEDLEGDWQADLWVDQIIYHLKGTLKFS